MENEHMAFTGEHKAVMHEGVGMLQEVQNKFLSAAHPSFGGILSIIETALDVGKALINAVK